MTHTNVQIPRLYGEIDQWRARVLLDAELKFWRERAEQFAGELENIADAIEKHGYVTLPDGTKLIPEKPPAAAE